MAANTNYVGRFTSYDMTVGLRLDMEDLIHLLSPFETPLQGSAMADGRLVIPRGDCFEVKVEWMEDELLTPRASLTATATTGETTLTFATADRIRFQTGDVVRQRDELIRITGYITTNSTGVTSTRAYAGAATDLTTTDTVVGVGQALPEGGDPPDSRVRDRNPLHNLTQIFGPYKVEASGTEDAVQKFGIRSTEFDYQAVNRGRELMIGVDQAMLYGERVDDTTNKWRTMGGFSYYISTNKDTTTTDVTETKLLDQIQNCYDAGGSPELITTGATQKRKISGIGSSNIRYGQETAARSQVVDSLDTDFGRLAVILNRWVRKTDLFIWEREQTELCTLRPMQFEMLAKTGDARKAHVLSEKTIKFRREKHAARFTKLS